MGTKKKSIYKGFDLKWLINKAEELKKYVDDRPLEKLSDRDFLKQTAKGGVVHMIAATVEQQRADLGKALKDYAEVCAMIKELEKDEVAKEELRKGFDKKNVLDG